MFDPLLVGSTLEWTAETSPAEVKRQLGPYVVTVTKQETDDLIAPAVEIAYGKDVVRLKGELLSPSFTHYISAIQNYASGSPIVMLQSFTGGAHCCNHVQLAGLSDGKLKVIELGTWDGDKIALPEDLSGDGIADFVVTDDSFLYAFAPYAMSHSPPQILNVIGGRAIDVSRRPAFRRLFVNAMNESGRVCRSGEDGMTRNGACPAYVASAGRVGKLSAAWSDMLAAYDATVDWDLPTGCTVSAKRGCPNEREIYFKSYPEALLYFLKERGYIPRNWQPPESYQGHQSEAVSDEHWSGDNTM
jgi:hypothetical protein